MQETKDTEILVDFALEAFDFDDDDCCCDTGKHYDDVQVALREQVERNPKYADMLRRALARKL